MQVLLACRCRQKNQHKSTQREKHTRTHLHGASREATIGDE